MTTNNTTKNTATSLEEFDIRESFDALDDEKLGLLSMDQFYTLYLGLGYEPKVTPEEMNARVQEQKKKEEEEEEEANDNENKEQEDKLTVEMALKVLSKFSRNRQDELSTCFTLVDHEKKGYISAQDIERLSTIVGQPMTLNEAEALLAQSSRGGDSTSSNRTMLRERDFERLFSPPSP